MTRYMRQPTKPWLYARIRTLEASITDCDMRWRRQASVEQDAKDKAWLRDCVKVGLAGIVLGLLVGGVWL